MRNGDLTKRAEVKTGDEIESLAMSFNQMAETLQISQTQLSSTDDQLRTKVAERKQAEDELKAAQEKLIETAHRAGMAEVAAYILHIVGNVLNSINVSTTIIREKVANSELANLVKVASIINEHTGDLGTFLTEHPQGKHIPVYLTEVSKCLQNEQTDIVSRLRSTVVPHRGGNAKKSLSARLIPQVTLSMKLQNIRILRQIRGRVDVI